MSISIKTPTEIEAMRESGRILATILQTLVKATKPGVTPIDMAELAANELKKMGGEPAFMGFHGYKDVICISVNNQVQHSIPDNRVFAEGDVVNAGAGVRA